MTEDEFFCEKVSGSEMDQLLAEGYRHFGEYFFRYRMTFHDSQIAIVQPLRIRLKNFQFSKSQRKLMVKNANLSYEFKPAFINDEILELFNEHAEKFVENKPKSIYTYLSEDPAQIPGGTYFCLVYKDGKLVAVSFLDIGEHSTSSIYGMFRLELAKLRLGIYTMLLEIEYSIQTNKEFYYPGYAYDINSFYDYKKEFHALEYLDWKKKEWIPLPRKINS